MWQLIYRKPTKFVYVSKINLIFSNGLNIFLLKDVEDPSDTINYDVPTKSNTDGNVVWEMFPIWFILFLEQNSPVHRPLMNSKDFFWSSAYSF